ncbi:hypothetical protein [Piscinibacter sp.]|uniref:hypothetical protein n=1 Tax=Piscinibacter sp. TaxID=1903157 RepID=UPI002B6AA547|nr:hypothetical protein [Albitalea sp.]HUG26173.1 hypothetical protein [Albitalea sp.]
MGPYLHWLTVNVEHSYFPDGACRALRFVPTPATATLLDKAGCIVRGGGSGLVVYAEAPPAEALGVDAAALDWFVHAQDTHFAGYTAHAAPAPGSLLFFDGARAVPEEGGGRRLHAGAHVGSDDAFPFEWPALARMLSAAHRRVPPTFAVRVPLHDADGVRWRIRFDARATVWKYYLLGGWTEERLQVVDPNREAAFAPPVEERLDSGQAALAIRSLAPIPLRERSPQRFQLRANGGGTDKVLVKRLPVAGARQFSRETVNGVSTLVSEIYVHR